MSSLRPSAAARDPDSASAHPTRTELPPPTVESLDALVRGFEECTLPDSQWTHAAHLLTALRYVQRDGAVEAARRMRTGLQRFLAAKGKDATAYHETITLAWIALIDELLAREGREQPLDTLARALLEQLGDKNLLFHYYSRRRLISAEARDQWVPPDLKPLPEPWHP